MVGIASQGASAVGAALFGGSAGFMNPSAESIFAASTLDTAQQSLSLSIKALDRKLNHLQGFKTDLHPAKQKRVDDIYKEIANIEKKAGPKGLDEFDQNKRTELYQEAYSILGKDYVNTNDDPELKDLLKDVDKLLEPKLQGAKAKRLKTLRTLEENLLDQFNSGNSSEFMSNQIKNVLKQISDLVPPRKMSELKADEVRQYDELVETINNKAGTDLLLSSKNKKEAEKINDQLQKLKAQAAALGVGQQQHFTQADAARVYAAAG